MITFRKKNKKTSYRSLSYTFFYKRQNYKNTLNKWKLIFFCFFGFIYHKHCFFVPVTSFFTLLHSSSFCSSNAQHLVLRYNQSFIVSWHCFQLQQRHKVLKVIMSPSNPNTVDLDNLRLGVIKPTGSSTETEKGRAL